MRCIVKNLITVVLFSAVSGVLAQAAEVTLVPSNPVVTLGSTFSVDITVSLDAEAGEQLAGGVIDLGYDDGVVEIIEVTIDPYWDFLPDPGSKTGAGLWEDIGFDAFVNPPASDTAVIASVTLEALAAGTSQLAVLLPSSHFFSATAEFFPTVTGASIQVNTLPVADDQTIATDEDTAALVTLTGSDSDGDELTYAVVAGPANGTLGGTAPDLTYTPAVDFNGTDSFTFQINDGNADSNVAMVSITVNPVEDIPVADDRSVTTSEDTAAAITLTGSDADGDPVTFSVVADPTNGSLSGTAPDLTYTPAADFNGNDSFTYRASDGKADSPSATVSITVNAVNDAPLADNQAVTTDEDTAAAVTLTGSDVDSESLSFSVVTGPTHGTLSGTAPDLTYTPAADFNGADSFTFQAKDGALDSNLATVSIEVSPVEDVPVAEDQVVTTDEDIAAAITLTGSDADGDSMTFSVVTDPANGTLSGTAPDLTYTPGADFNGTDSFTYRARDGKADSLNATVSITVNAVNDAPLADPGLDETIVLGATVELDGANSGDVEGDDLTFRWTLVSTPAESSAVLSDAGVVNPSFLADLAGDYVVQLIVNDGLVDSAPATVTITADVDTDSDGVPQSIDNCTAVANADQRDTDGDGYGNLCDGDLDNDGDTNTLDLNLYKLAHRTEAGDPAYDPDADFDGDSSIDTLDLNIYKGLHRLPPGPSCCGD